MNSVLEKEKSEKWMQFRTDSCSKIYPTKFLPLTAK